MHSLPENTYLKQRTLTSGTALAEHCFRRRSVSKNKVFLRSLSNLSHFISLNLLSNASFVGIVCDNKTIWIKKKKRILATTTVLDLLYFSVSIGCLRYHCSQLLLSELLLVLDEEIFTPLETHRNAKNYRTKNAVNGAAVPFKGSSPLLYSLPTWCICFLTELENQSPMQNSIKPFFWNHIR